MNRGRFGQKSSEVAAALAFRSSEDTENKGFISKIKRGDSHETIIFDSKYVRALRRPAMETLLKTGPCVTRNLGCLSDTAISWFGTWPRKRRKKKAKKETVGMVSAL